MTLSCFLVVLLLCVLVPGQALARKNVQHKWSWTISPIHLLLPVGEVTGEYRLSDRVGLAGILGVGQVTVEDTWGEETTFFTYELGASARYYVLGSFIHGMQVGLEALYAGVSGSKDDVSGTGAGIAVGPFIGYKIAANVGFTFDAQLGTQYMMASAEASNNSNGTSDSASDSGWGVLLNLNLGWSF